jgi:hypothetical protein
MVSQMEDFTSSRAFRVAGAKGLRRRPHHAQRCRPTDDLRCLRASADLRPRGSRLCTAWRGRSFHRRAYNTASAASCRSTPMAAASPTCIPECTACTACTAWYGMYGMYALQESVRQTRGTAPAQIPDAKISVCHGVGRHVRRLRHDHHAERTAVSPGRIFRVEQENRGKTSNRS